MALTDYDKKNLSAADQKKVQAATDKWNAANKAGDANGMREAAAEAAAVRNNAGYKTDSSGNYTGSYSPTSSGGSSGGNSQYTGSATGVTTYNSSQQNIVDMMNENSKAWWSASPEERKRLEQTNQQLSKYLGSGVTYDAKTGLWSGAADYSTGDQIRDWNESYNETYEKPTQPTSDPRIDELLNQILTREDFSYDVMNDPLFQQYADIYKREGDRAMRETMAEAAASAGGMNTYAITAAQQANNYYNSQLYDRIPELYQLAYNMYLNDKESQVQNLGILQDMDTTQYNRYRDTMSDWYADKNFAYGSYMDAVNQDNWKANYDYNSYWDNKTFDNDNFWANKEFNYKDYWANKDYETNQADKEYERTKAEQDEALALIDWYIQNGVTSGIDDELISKAGITRAAVDQMIAYKKQQEAPKTTSSSGGGGGSNYTPKGNDDGNDEEKGDDDDGNTPKVVEEEEEVKNDTSWGGISDYTEFDNMCREINMTKGPDGVMAFLKECLETGAIDIMTYMQLNNKYKSIGVIR